MVFAAVATNRRQSVLTPIHVARGPLASTASALTMARFTVRPTATARTVKSARKALASLLWNRNVLPPKIVIPAIVTSRPPFASEPVAKRMEIARKEAATWRRVLALYPIPTAPLTKIASQGFAIREVASA